MFTNYKTFLYPNINAPVRMCMSSTSNSKYSSFLYKKYSPKGRAPMQIDRVVTQSKRGNLGL